MAILAFLAAAFLLLLPFRYVGSGEVYRLLGALSFFGLVLIGPGMVLAATLRARTYRSQRRRGTPAGTGARATAPGPGALARLLPPALGRLGLAALGRLRLARHRLRRRGLETRCGSGDVAATEQRAQQGLHAGPLAAPERRRLEVRQVEPEVLSGIEQAAGHAAGEVVGIDG